ncbi:putative undecaprenyl-diphosphatase UppP [delta proteobacterium NaphS2]|nr:putative undecaprenyl-diphosphatase UppP [delta proteobacterium NaphS2]
MNSLETTLLGIVQGLTEFLPVSSSGHLVILEHLLGLKEPEILLDTSLHLGTLLAVCVFFRSDLAKMIQELWSWLKPESNGKTDFGPHASMAVMVVVGSIPTALIGLIFKDPLERLFGAVTIVGAMLLVTGLITGITKFISETHEKWDRINVWMALAIGAVQGLAIVPGISRSGATIVCALLLGLRREIAGRFSFLLSIPAIVGAVALQLKSDALARVGAWPLFLGFASAAVVGFFALKLLMGMVRKGHFYYFAPYCFVVGALTVILF